MRELLGNADCVLFDFDGPICSLFAARPAASIAQRLRALAEELSHPPGLLLTAELRATDDPHAVLRGVARSRPDPAVVRRLEQALTHEEVYAAGNARPTPHAAALVRALAERGRKLAIVTNNSPLAVAGYLSKHRMADHFAGHLHGRTADVALLKPHPDVLYRALDSTRTPPGRALVIGDTPSDLVAARAAGAAFIGYAPDEAAGRLLSAAGAPHLTHSLDDVLRELSASSVG
ncbi:HAD-IA family hydrolase [Streptomyces sp. ACA25]|uniref:HAD family hydrolase n=1 Tax=Streptomyces sp. ACA25 TaxID=3022596 RepID=UPI00230778DB|nr:HAD-IA family hydrolase [Streptomyces sp. ACA25]MDB1087947.1 HAD-IA family hydrolase [Streptomyces sp. ACA25]